MRIALTLVSLIGTVFAQERLPNVLLIMADDLGWSDLHCQGNAALDTPHIDRLARQGTRFTDAYAAAPVCSPVRAALMTGRSPARLKITNHIPDRPGFTPKSAVLDPAPAGDRLPLQETTLAERLRLRGYSTGFFGKWHLCGTGKGRDNGRGDPDFLPEKQGFDVNVGGCAWGGPPTFWDPYRIWALPSRKEGEYLPDRLADEVISFMGKKRDGPFLACLWNYSVHWPMEAPDHLVKKYSKRVGPGVKDARYAAMIEALDASLGRVLAALDELGIAEQTLVVFTSDNGGYQGVADNRPLREGKGYLYEGGIRVPLIVRWPGVSRAGTTCATPAVTMDVHATILDAAGVGEPDPLLEGESLRRFLVKDGQGRRAPLRWHYPNYAWHKSNRLGGAVRDGDLKLIERYDDGSRELYDLSKDLSEKNDIASERPEDAARLSRDLHAWLRETKAAMPTRR